METKYDLIVIGAGPGGYTAAIKAARAGLRTAVIEAREVGGTCLNRGCIPAKAMLHASSLYREMQEAARFGIMASSVTYDYGKILSYKEETAKALSQGVEQLLKANKVDLIRGQAMLKKDGTITVQSGSEMTVLNTKQVILAAGSKPLELPIPGMKLPGVLNSDRLFQLTAVPDSLLIIGGGVISVEFATIFQALGTSVTIVEAMPRLIPNMDKEISQNLKMILKKRGIDVHVDAAVSQVAQNGSGLTCMFTEKEKLIEISAQYILCAVGRCPNTEGLFEAGAEPEMERGRIVIDKDFCSSIANVYAIGDLISGAQLAHTASAQGIYVAEKLAGKTPDIDLTVIPGCVYTDPEIAAVGITEEIAKEKGQAVVTGKFIMSANGKSLISKADRGFIKIIADAETEVILGGQMMCPRATDMIGEVGTAIANKLTVTQMLKAMRAHPTYNEAVAEALEDIHGQAVHIMPKKR
ncbi:MAG: dihydrolipoyl dehydrogenase [Lachnospiraceae bacterium]